MKGRRSGMNAALWDCCMDPGPFSRARYRAGVDDERLRDPAFDPFQADFDGRGADLVGREHAGHGRRDFRDDECEVAFSAFLRTFPGAEPFDVAENAGGQETFGSNNGAGNESEFCLHEVLPIFLF